jgi:hypothetical protein
LIQGSALTLKVVDAATGARAPRPSVGVISKSGRLPPDTRFYPPQSDSPMMIEHYLGVTGFDPGEEDAAGCCGPP